MGSIIPSLTPTCICSGKDKDEDFDSKYEIKEIKKEQMDMRVRIYKLEIESKDIYKTFTAKVEALQQKIESKFNVIDEQFRRIEDKLETKFDLIMMTLQSNGRRESH